MRLEYEIATTGRDKLIRDLRTIDQELEKQARRTVSRDGKTERARIQLRDVSAKKRATVEEVAAKAAASAEIKAAKMAAAAKIAEERKAAAEYARLLRWRQSLQNRHYQQLEVSRKRSELSEIRSQQRMARTAALSRGRTAARFTAGMGRVATGAAGIVNSGIRTVGGIVGIGGGLLAGNAISTQISEQATASKLANQAGNPALKGELLAQAQNTKGFTGEEAMGGLSAFVEKTGDLESGRALLADMSRMALAFNTDLEDMGRTAGQAFTVLSDQVGPQEAIKQTSELMKTLAQQGNLGAVEMSDLARVFGKLGAATRSFEGDAPELLRQMGAFAQIAVQRGGASSSEEAATAASRLAQDMVGEKRKKFERILGKGGLQSKTDKTKLRDPLEIMIDVLNKTGGDIMKTGDLFGGESKKIFAGLSATYSAAESQQKGSGEKAVRAEFEKFAGATKTDEQINAAVNSRMEDPDIKIKESFKKLNQVVGERLVPEVIKIITKLTSADMIANIGKFTDKVVAFGHQVAPLVESLAGILGTLASITGTLIENDPFGGLGVLVGGLIAKELLAAGIASVTSSGIEKIVTMLATRFGGGAPIPVPKAVPLVTAGGAAITAAVGATIFNGAMSEEDSSAAGNRRNTYDPSKLHNFIGGMKDSSKVQGSPEAIQSMLGVGGQGSSGQQKPIDMAQFDAVAQKQKDAADAQKLAAEAMTIAAKSMQNGNNRTTPIVRR